ncbi:hypothetical protein C8J57DRAFT_564243, partial [Mycena rebaudengoi]
MLRAVVLSWALPSTQSCLMNSFRLSNASTLKKKKSSSVGPGGFSASTLMLTRKRLKRQLLIVELTTLYCAVELVILSSLCELIYAVPLSLIP